MTHRMHEIEPEENWRNATAAALLSIIPGIGQIYCRETKRGLALLFGLPLQAAIFLAAGLPWLMALLGIVWLWNILDASQLVRGEKPSVGFPIFLLIAINLAAGWSVTRMDIGELVRGVPEMRRITSSLVHPNMFERRHEDITASTKYITPGPGAPILKQTKEPDEERGISLNPIEAKIGQRVNVTGWGFPTEQRGRLYLYVGAERPGPTFKTDSEGRFNTSFINEARAPGDYFVKAVVKQLYPGWQPTQTLRLASELMLLTIYLALMGTALSIIVAVPLSFFGARNLMKGTTGRRIGYMLTRGFFNLVRSVEVLIIAVMLVAAVGVGPFAGVLALAIHGIGALGKLYSEAIESIDPGPIEAITATGASRLQVIVFGVAPQVIPQFISFTMYRWDINVRMATVIGLVGGGGIGYILLQYIGLLQWREAATAIWLIAAVVMLMDYVSAVIREKLV